MGSKNVVQAIQQSVIRPPGDVWYVDGTNGGATYSGRTPDRAFSTLALADTAAGANDWIVIAPGTYTVDVSTASITPAANQVWMAAVPSFGGFPNVTIIADADDGANPLFAMDVSGVVFKDIMFKLVAGGTTALYLVSASQTTAVNGLAFINCWFDLNDVDANAVAMKLDDATNATTGLVLDNCRFTGGSATTGAIDYITVGVGGIPAALIQNCVFELESADGDCRGIAFADPTASAKCYAMTIRNNDFIGPTDAGADAVGIEFTAAMTDNEILGSIRDNFFPGCATTPITQDESSKSCINNYVPDAAGGALVDVTA